MAVITDKDLFGKVQNSRLRTLARIEKTPEAAREEREVSLSKTLGRLKKKPPKRVRVSMPPYAPRTGNPPFRFGPGNWWRVRISFIDLSAEPGPKRIDVTYAVKAESEAEAEEKAIASLNAEFDDVKEVKIAHRERMGNPPKPPENEMTMWCRRCSAWRYPVETGVDEGVKIGPEGFLVCEKCGWEVRGIDEVEIGPNPSSHAPLPSGAEYSDRTLVAWISHISELEELWKKSGLTKAEYVKRNRDFVARHVDFAEYQGKRLPRSSAKEKETMACPSCGGPLFFAGTLGNKAYYRCRHCSKDFPTSEFGANPSMLVIGNPLTKDEQSQLMSKATWDARAAKAYMGSNDRKAAYHFGRAVAREEDAKLYGPRTGNPPCPCGGTLATVSEDENIRILRCAECGAADVQYKSGDAKRETKYLYTHPSKGTVERLALGRRVNMTKGVGMRYGNPTTQRGFIEFLQYTLIPDLRESESFSLADDFETAIEHMKHPEGRGAKAFAKWLRGTLIPDLRTSGLVETAKDFETAANFIERKENPPMLVLGNPPNPTMHHGFYVDITYKSSSSPTGVIATRLPAVAWEKFKSRKAAMAGFRKWMEIWRGRVPKGLKWQITEESFHRDRRGGNPMEPYELGFVAGQVYADNLIKKDPGRVNAMLDDLSAVGFMNAFERHVGAVARTLVVKIKWPPSEDRESMNDAWAQGFLDGAFQVAARPGENPLSRVEAGYIKDRIKSFGRDMKTYAKLGDQNREAYARGERDMGYEVLGLADRNGNPRQEFRSPMTKAEARAYAKHREAGGNMMTWEAMRATGIKKMADLNAIVSNAWHTAMGAGEPINSLPAWKVDEYYQATARELGYYGMPSKRGGNPDDAFDVTLDVVRSLRPGQMVEIKTWNEDWLGVVAENVGQILTLKSLDGSVTKDFSHHDIYEVEVRGGNPITESEAGEINKWARDIFLPSAQTGHDVDLGRILGMKDIATAFGPARGPSRARVAKMMERLHADALPQGLEGPAIQLSSGYKFPKRRGNPKGKKLDVYLMGDQPTTCPKCGGRTDFKSFSFGRQRHVCLGCKYRFIVEQDRNGNPAPSFVVINAKTGEVVFSKAASGTGQDALSKALDVAHKMADDTGNIYWVFLNMMPSVKKGSKLSLPMVRAMGVSQVVGPRIVKGGNGRTHNVGGWGDPGAGERWEVQEAFRSKGEAQIYARNLAGNLSKVYGIPIETRVRDYGQDVGKGRWLVEARKEKRGGNPHELPAQIENDPKFQRELAAYRRRHGSDPVHVTPVQVPKGYPKFMSVYGEIPEAKYDAPQHSKKGKRIHHFGKHGKNRPHLASSVEKGPKFLAIVGGSFKAKTDWLHD